MAADCDCRHEIKTCLLLGRKPMSNLENILKSKDITLPTKLHLVKAMVCLVVMYGCESWTIKKAEWRIIDAFELWFWRRLLRVPWTARRSNQSTLKEIRTDSLEKTLILGKIEGRKRRGNRVWDVLMSPTQWTWLWISSRNWWWTGNPGLVQSMGLQRVGHDWVTELNWTILSTSKVF